MNYYIADLHLGHANVIRFDQRPFATVDEMNDTLIRNWNETVTRGDTVYILGDLIWSKEAQWPEWLDKLKGQKVLIRGNHDPKEFSAKTKSYFQDIANLKEIVDGGRHVIMCHYPIPFHRADYDEKCIMLYGHVHVTREYEIIERLRKDVRDAHTQGFHALGQFINVGCMMPWMDYRPRMLDEILQNERPLCESHPVPDKDEAEWVYDRPHHWYCSRCKTMYGYVHVTMKFCSECGAKMKPHSYEEAVKDNCRPESDPSTDGASYNDDTNDQEV